MSESQGKPGYKNGLKYHLGEGCLLCVEDVCGICIVHMYVYLYQFVIHLYFYMLHIYIYNFSFWYPQGVAFIDVYFITVSFNDVLVMLI